MSSRGRSTSPKPLTPSPRRAAAADVSMSPARNGSREPGGSSSGGPPKVVVVQGLSKNVYPAHLREIFGVYGRVTGLDLPVFKFSGLNRGKAAIEFDAAAAADDAVRCMDGGVLDGSVLRVQNTPCLRRAQPRPLRAAILPRAAAARRAAAGRPHRVAEREATRRTVPARARPHRVVALLCLLAAAPPVLAEAADGAVPHQHTDPVRVAGSRAVAVVEAMPLAPEAVSVRAAHRPSAVVTVAVRPTMAPVAAPTMALAARRVPGRARSRAPRRPAVVARPAGPGAAAARLSEQRRVSSPLSCGEHVPFQTAWPDAPATGHCVGGELLPKPDQFNDWIRKNTQATI
ncbi:uncharacterized protein EHS24_004641 [Apiotrichum porosum]|uniref:RRM domain-containing protein n=1 Tax=Apiotrichum porosum TaxID=105984 RepID=A0A427Y5N2_9TREE|nr:uncharacterized protein EHS24_004641 [Apiotrichum porosum]RSH86391.1 hypothetical protein EHS24_004641 [Apiotrichum porosum]